MATATITSSAINRNPGLALEAAMKGPVFITYRGKPNYVLLSIEDYEKLARK
ncbi:MAG: type II toxin-antitoxin system prevent-host-death family antitoxin [Terracidiphilus sp.]